MSKWIAMHEAYTSKAEYRDGWRFVHQRGNKSIFIKVKGIENAKWVARKLNANENFIWRVR